MPPPVTITITITITASLVPFHLPVQLVGNTTERMPAEYAEKNPMEQIPLLEFTDPADGSSKSLTQSLAIIEYLEEAFPETARVLPSCPLKRARARQVWLLLFFLPFFSVFLCCYLLLLCGRLVLLFLVHFSGSLFVCLFA
jgi:hypothetical protein